MMRRRPVAVERELANGHGWMDGWVDGWMYGWMDGWMDGWVDGWMAHRTVSTDAVAAPGYFIVAAGSY